MTYAILSDIHANLEALERILADAREAGATCFVCLGDIVGYGPQPTETLARIRETCSIAIAGNHDDAVSGRGNAEDFISLAGDAVRRHRETLPPEDRDYLARLPYTAAVSEALAVHGSPVCPTDFPYVDSEDAASEAFDATDVQLVFVGHTHVPEFFLTGESGRVYRVPPQDFTLENGKRYLVNPGSVGYPRERDGICRSSYVLYDDEARTIQYRFLPFSVSSVMERGTGAHSPVRKRLGLPIATGIFLVLLAIAALFWMRPHSLQPQHARAESVILATRTISLTAKSQTVNPNLRIEDGPVKLAFTFRDENGLCVGTRTNTVKDSCCKRFKKPPNAVEVCLVVFNPNTNKVPRVANFAPFEP